MTEKDKYGFNQAWLDPQVQAEVYRQFNAQGELVADDGGYVLSHIAADEDFCVRLVDEVVEHLCEDDYVLSVAEGQGHLVRELLTRGLKHIECVDICPENVAAAQKQGIAMIEGNAHALPYGEDVFDVVIINESIGAIGLSDALVEARRVLKIGGRIIITTYVYIEHDDVDVSSDVVKYRYVLPTVIEQALKEHDFKVTHGSSVMIRELPQELIDDGHEGDHMRLIVAEKKR